MGSAVQFTGIDAFINGLQAASQAKIQEIDARVQEAGLNTEAQAKRDCPVGTPESTHKKNYHGGRLRASIQYVRSGLAECTVGSDVFYADFVNSGTKKMKARPFLTNAYIKERQALMTDLQEIAKQP